ncbi:hypothetical protein CC1G_09939 [Coprinopsis cinerea okayama7|uniref:Uncharacterized protein n=1 Tax=Coprinopsis cinerea (strain Okayama-7 / 130 / ATCC MYA-4618 / FGSC 9003) TaxID=240176 RepID=A8PGP0_COPC7|nr:hypothetical protein CC1G_09939 [Coprinopsis cinerea okayama7\|eukprot:XP_001841247.2 hypothetical protein CC1G_09939 [Coprinopsis cinerea okayama7\
MSRRELQNILIPPGLEARAEDGHDSPSSSRSSSPSYYSPHVWPTDTRYEPAQIPVIPLSTQFTNSSSHDENRSPDDFDPYLLVASRRPSPHVEDVLPSRSPDPVANETFVIDFDAREGQGRQHTRDLSNTSTQPDTPFGTSRPYRDRFPSDWETRPIKLPRSRSPSLSSSSSTPSRKGVRKFLLRPSLASLSSRDGPRHFERPQYKRFIIHLALCGAIYPALLVATILAHGKTIFWARFITAAFTLAAGLALASSLVEMAKRIAEAAVWATIIHQTKFEGSPGIRMKDLVGYARSMGSAWSGLCLLWDRHAYPGADRDTRKRYDSRHWPLYIWFYVLVTTFSLILPFLLGRAVDIDVEAVEALKPFNVAVSNGDLSDLDVERLRSQGAMLSVDSALRWTLFTPQGDPLPVALQSANHTVYFSPPDTLEIDGLVPKPIESGLLRVPRWGIRINCVPLSNGKVNVVPRAESGAAYVFTTREDLQAMFPELSIPVPEHRSRPLIYSSVMAPNDSLPAGMDLESIVLGARFNDTGESLSVAQMFPYHASERFLAFSTTLIRLNTAFAPNGDFSHSISISSGEVGYDAVNCLQVYEPWLVEIHYANNLPPKMTRILEKKPLGDAKGDIPDGVARSLDSRRMSNVFDILQQNGINGMLKDYNVAGSSRYAPSPSIISLTDGELQPLGYTQLDATRYAHQKAQSDAKYVLSHLSGAEPLAAQWYPYENLATASINAIWFSVTLGISIALGTVAAFCTPTLPLSHPRRGLDLYSVFSALYTRELLSTRTGRLRRQMELEEIEEILRDSRVRFVN